MPNAWTRPFAALFVSLVALGGALSCASVDPGASVGTERAAISGGRLDSIDSNVFVLVSHRGAEGAALCSASLIAPNLLLTARHCVANVTAEVVTCGQTEASTPFPGNTFFAANSVSVQSVTTVFKGATVSVPSDGTDICGFDIALITLASSVPSSVAVPLVPRIDRPVLRGEAYSAVGYGENSPGDAGLSGERMDRSGLKIGCAPGTCGQGVEASEFIGDTGICSGDSGGPALDAQGKVVGVVSRSGDACDHPVYGSVASWKDWIIGVATQAALQGNYTAPFWVQTGSSDPPPEPLPSGSVGATGSAGAGASLGTQGEACASPGECASGFGCYSPTSSASNAYCAAFCSAQAPCAGGMHCQAGVGVCVPEAGSVSSSSCALGAPGRSSAPGRGGLALALAALGLAACRRTGRGLRSGLQRPDADSAG